MKRVVLSIALVTATGVVRAQPAPQQPPQPAQPAEPAPPPTPPTTTEAPTSPTPPPTATAPETPVLVTTPPAEEHKDDKPAVAATYDGGLKLESEDGQYELKLGFRNQFRFEADRSFDTEMANRHNQFLNSFQIPRSRLGAEGHFFGKDNHYKIEAGLGDLGSFGFLKDMWLEKKVATAPVLVRAGQWKRPFNRAEMVSDFASTFNERSIENELAGGGRSLGIAVHNDYEKSPEGIGWVAGLFNTFNGGSDRPAWSTKCDQNAMTLAITCTNSKPTTVPPDFSPALVARVDYNSPKIKGFSESDLEGGPLRYSVGAAYKIDFANFTKGMQASWGDNLSHGLEVDANIKAMGYSLTGGAVMMKIKDAKSDWGFYVQPAWLFVPKHGEVALRFAMITVPPTMMAGERKEIEARAAANLYWHGHAWKVASDIGFLKLTGVDDKGNHDSPDMQIRVMLQAAI